MKNISKDSNGFRIVGIILVVVVVAVIGSLGWYVVAHKKVNSQNDSTTTQQTTSTQPKTVQTTTSQAQQAAPAPLVITEWGVKLPLTSTISDAYYVASNSGVGSDGKPNFFVSLKSLDGGGCQAINNNSGGTGAIGLLGHSPISQTDPVTGELITKKYPNGTTIGNYYYYFQDRTNGLTCTSQTNLQNISSAFVTGAKSMSSN